MPSLEIDRLRKERDTALHSVEALEILASDAQGRLIEVYEFARRSNDLAHGLQRELDSLRRDIEYALDGIPSVNNIGYDARHRDVVEAMGRLFVGAEATRYVGRSHLVDRISSLSGELKEQKQRADRAERFAADWHEQLVAIRKTRSWRWTLYFRRTSKFLFRK